MSSTDTISKTDHPTRYFVGIDGGGTYCRANIYDTANHLLGRGISGPANPANHLHLAQDSILAAVALALEDAQLHCNLDQLVVGAGLAGLHLPRVVDDMQQWQHPFLALHLTTDIHVALLGAHLGKDGAVIILGTGFSALGIVTDKQQAIGGYGFPTNAVCSGSWCGLELIKAVLLDFDGVGPPTSLTKEVLAEESILSLAQRMHNGSADQFATFAPLVFSHAQAGDQVAIDILTSGAAFINTVLQKFVDSGNTVISFVGGVAPHIQDWLKPEYKGLIVEPSASPEYGALLFAQEAQMSNPGK
jgi:glucosamine kinase